VLRALDPTKAARDGGERRDAHYAEFKALWQDLCEEYRNVNTFFH